MTDIRSNNNWYAVFTLTGEEDNVKERVKFKLSDNVRVLVPKRKLRERKDGVLLDVIRNIFPGYVLINGYIDVSTYYELNNIPGIVRLLSCGGLPLLIEQREIEILNKLICNSEVIGYSDILIENGNVIVVDGPLLSLEGYIKSIDKRKGRAKVILYFCGEERVVELGVSVLQPV